MSDLKCNQESCEETAAFRFTWPGRDEAGICIFHARQIQDVAKAMGLHLQLHPVHLTEPHVIKDLRVESVVLLDHCIYCGSKDFDKPGIHPRTGKVCNHPNKVHSTRKV